MLKKSLIFLTMMNLLVAEPFVMVANANTPVPSLNASEIKMIYLKQRRFWKDTKLTTLNLPPDNSLRRYMEDTILHMTQDELDHYWIKQHYKGLRPPYRVESIESMILFVKKVDGAIGYIPKSRLESGLKVIYESKQP